MPRKEKEIVWHKKKSKFLPVSFEKARVVSGGESAPAAVVSRRQQFALDLQNKIRAAVNKSSKDTSAS